MEEIVQALNRIADELHELNEKLGQNLSKVLAEQITNEVNEHVRKEEGVRHG